MIVAALGVVVLLGAIAAWLWLERPPAIRQRVIVNLQHDANEALRGVLWQSRGPWLVLRDVEALKAGQPPTAMDGEVLVHRSNVAFLQVIS